MHLNKAIFFTFLNVCCLSAFSNLSENVKSTVQEGSGSLTHDRTTSTMSITKSGSLSEGDLDVSAFGTTGSSTVTLDEGGTTTSKTIDYSLSYDAAAGSDPQTVVIEDGNGQKLTVETLTPPVTYDPTTGTYSGNTVKTYTDANGTTVTETIDYNTGTVKYETNGTEGFVGSLTTTGGTTTFDGQRASISQTDDGGAVSDTITRGNRSKTITGTQSGNVVTYNTTTPSGQSVAVTETYTYNNDGTVSSVIYAVNGQTVGVATANSNGTFTYTPSTMQRSLTEQTTGSPNTSVTNTYTTGSGTQVFSRTFDSTTGVTTYQTPSGTITETNDPTTNTNVFTNDQNEVLFTESYPTKGETEYTGSNGYYIEFNHNDGTISWD